MPQHARSAPTAAPARLTILAHRTIRTIISLSRLLAEQPEARAPKKSAARQSAAWQSAAGQGPAVGNRAFQAQFNFRSTARAAPDGQLGSDLFGTLAHSRQAVMAGAALLHDFRGNAL